MAPGTTSRPSPPPVAPPAVTIAPQPGPINPGPMGSPGPLLPPPQILRPTPVPGWLNAPPPPPASPYRGGLSPSPLVSPMRSRSGTAGTGGSLVDRYRDAVEAQQQFLLYQRGP